MKENGAIEDWLGADDWRSNEDDEDNKKRNRKKNVDIATELIWLTLRIAYMYTPVLQSTVIVNVYKRVLCGLLCYSDAWLIHGSEFMYIYKKQKQKQTSKGIESNTAVAVII